MARRATAPEPRAAWQVARNAVHKMASRHVAVPFPASGALHAHSPAVTPRPPAQQPTTKAARQWLAHPFRRTA
eukprot:2743354-Prymnesium_polylepis.3